MKSIIATGIFCFATATSLLFAEVIDSFDQPAPKPTIEPSTKTEVEKSIRDDRQQWVGPDSNVGGIDVPDTLSKPLQQIGSAPSKQKAVMDKFKRCKIKFWTKGALLDRKSSFLNLPKPVRIQKCDLKMRANRAMLVYDQKTQKIKRIEAYGNVRVEKRDSWTGMPIKARSASLVYDNQSQKIAIVGEPASLQRGSAEEFQSRRIEYDILQDVVETDSAEGEVGNP